MPTRLRTRRTSTVDPNQAELENVLRTNQAKKSADRKAKLEERKRQSATALGTIAWNDIFENEELKLPDTSFMSHLKKLIPRDQFKTITDDMINTLKEEKEDFCQANYNTLQEAKKQLYALLTNIITDESGYFIS